MGRGTSKAGGGSNGGGGNSGDKAFINDLAGAMARGEITNGDMQAAVESYGAGKNGFDSDSMIDKVRAEADRISGGSSAVPSVSALSSMTPSGRAVVYSKLPAGSQIDVTFHNPDWGGTGTTTHYTLEKVDTNGPNWRIIGGPIGTSGGGFFKNRYNTSLQIADDSLKITRVKRG